MALLDGLGATLAAFALCATGAGMIASKQLDELPALEAEDPPVRISVVHWNY
jgi:hypothetical protein